jgi:hypothetical protein
MCQFWNTFLSCNAVQVKAMTSQVYEAIGGLGVNTVTCKHESHRLCAH